MHFSKECSYSDSKCTDCGQIGHKSGYCPPPDAPSGKKKSQNSRKFPQKKKKNPQARANAVFSRHRRGRRFLSPEVNGHILTFQLDSAADVSVISSATWEKIGKPALSTASLIVKDAQSNKIQVAGEFEAIVRFRDKEIRARCLVSDKTRDNLFGIEWMDALDLWEVALSAYCNAIQRNIDKAAAIRELQGLFPTVFSPEMGLYTKAVATIHLKSNAMPVFRPKRPVAFHMTEVIDEELQRLQASEIISPTEFSSWEASIVVARKSNRNIRICGDYSTELNEAVEANNHPIPDPDSLFTKLAHRSSLATLICQMLICKSRLMRIPGNF
ncbi:uncharacterized protein K02A2.6-like [Phlebotomus papatasi]|uniref:uncharacterized protein K02A2.6-like n=1 Tax=Phlebotomus papatasi TaxID=29031 RepID=UPI0024833505|nr:uncharacterized protein K02A2.6-like [Phlebotomus papatasi]